jgi:hypothetical protein
MEKMTNKMSYSPWKTRFSSAPVILRVYFIFCLATTLYSILWFVAPTERMRLFFLSNFAFIPSLCYSVSIYFIGKMIFGNDRRQFTKLRNAAIFLLIAQVVIYGIKVFFSKNLDLSYPVLALQLAWVVLVPLVWIILLFSFPVSEYCKPR